MRTLRSEYCLKALDSADRGGGRVKDFNKVFAYID